MGRQCTVCAHDQVTEIDRLIVEGTTAMRRIADKFNLKSDAVGRHRDAHISPALKSVARDREAKAVTSLIDRVEELMARTERFLATAEKTGQVAQGLAAVRELRALLELLGKATGELHEAPATVINILASPDWLRVRAALFDSLARFPDARAQVAERLLLLEDGHEQSR